jgi:hypothetical protein
MSMTTGIPEELWAGSIIPWPHDPAKSCLLAPALAGDGSAIAYPNKWAFLHSRSTSGIMLPHCALYGGRTPEKDNSKGSCSAYRKRAKGCVCWPMVYRPAQGLPIGGT